MTYRVGIIGFGIMGQRMASNMALHDAFDVVSIFDPQQSLPDLPYANSAEGLIADPDLDLVYIACPPEYHADYAIAAAKAGKPVFCEKPLGVDVAESQKLVETIERMGARNAVNFSFAASPARAFLRSFLADGGFGTIDAIDIRLHFATWPRDWQAAATWLGKRLQGGYVREVLSHFIYLTESVFGPLTLEQAMTRYPDGPGGAAAESHVFATACRFRSPAAPAAPGRTAWNSRSGARKNPAGSMTGIRHIYPTARPGSRPWQISTRSRATPGKPAASASWTISPNSGAARPMSSRISAPDYRGYSRK